MPPKLFFGIISWNGNKRNGIVVSERLTVRPGEAKQAVFTGERRMRHRQNHRQRTAGYSLIELLTVIAIIAIVAAILVPVFASVRESVRQKTVMSNLSAISKGIAQFELDNHRAPEVLFGYANAATMPQATLDPQHPGLFPQFIHDPAVFTDPSNTIGLDDMTPVSASVNVLTPAANGTGTLTPVMRSFYRADAYDSNPTVTGSETLDTSTTGYKVRYQTSWTALNPALNAANPRQMRFLNPPGDTYVACSTYHVPKGKVIVLWQNGEAKILDTSRFQEGANFWQVTP